jgi:hypothetical protein
MFVIVVGFKLIINIISQKPGVGPAKSMKKAKAKQVPRSVNMDRDKTTASPIPDHAALCRPKTNKWSDIKLLEQPTLVQKVVRKAIKDMTAHMLLTCAWPDIISRPIFGKPILLTAAKELQSQYPQIKDVRDQLRENEDYVQALSHLVSLDFAFYSKLTPESL